MPDPHPLPIVADLLREHGMDEAAERLLARCETCEHWGRSPERVYVSWDWGVDVPSLRVCGGIQNRTVEGSPPDDLAFVIGLLNDTDAAMWTHASFSCHFWEKRSLANA